MERRGGLGKGLGALIPSDVAPSSAAGLAARPGIEEIPINQIDPNPYQPRNSFAEESLAGLTASIRELGVLQPILVRQMSDDRYAIIAGERRWRAAKRAGLQFIPVIVRQVNDELTLEHALVENLHRDDLNPLEEAAAYQQLVEDFDLTQEEVAHKVGKSRSAVANLLRLFQLPPQVQRLVAEGRVSAGHAKALLGTPDRAFQESLARRVASDGLSVRDTEEAVRQRNGLAGSPSGSTGSSSGRSKLRAPGLLELEELLAEQLDTRVSINVGPKRGRVVIEFADLEDLERIYRVMAGPH
ncbi:MAG TPA: ParB/RepB/Spo0J family partition protein [Acidimicrobiales bacterium]|nr:ParB/RepB/Spo0J family partition protein [Acidimicrobiales bacterium]